MVDDAGVGGGDGETWMGPHPFSVALWQQDFRIPDAMCWHRHVEAP